VNEIDEARTLEAIDALGGWSCQNCGIEMRDPAYCDACCSLYCPYCGIPAVEECRHLLVIDDPDWELSPSPFEGLALPHLPERPDGFWPLDEWPEADLERSFGDLRPLLEAYDSNGLDSEPGERNLWREIKWMLSETPGSLNRFVPSHPGHSHYEDAFFEDPDKARAEIADIFGRLRAGFERLGARHQK
jgi:hypothetical protein